MTRFQLAPVRVFLVMAVFGEMAFLTFATLSSVYRITEASLDPLQLVLVGTVLEATVFLFEVPAGIVADVYSRKLSLIIGFASIGAGFIGFQALSNSARFPASLHMYSLTLLQLPQQSGSEKRTRPLSTNINHNLSMPKFSGRKISPQS